MSDEEEKLKIVRQLQAAGYSPAEIERHLADYDEQSEERAVDQAVRIHADRIADKLIGPGSGVILGPDGKPLKK